MTWVAQEIEGEMMPFISVTREKRNKREYLSPLGGHFFVQSFASGEDSK